MCTVLKMDSSLTFLLKVVVLLAPTTSCVEWHLVCAHRLSVWAILRGILLRNLELDNRGTLCDSCVPVEVLTHVLRWHT